MNHEITLTQTDDQWKQVMVCEFANSTIAELVIGKAHTERDGHNRVILCTNEKRRAYVERKENTITLTCKCTPHGWWLGWDKLDPSISHEGLERIAKEWQTKEQVYLPIMQYFEVGAREYNVSFRKWAKKHDEELANLEHQIKELERKLSALDQRLDETNHVMYKELRQYGEALTELEEGFADHEKMMFHFLDRKEQRE